MEPVVIVGGGMAAARLARRLDAPTTVIAGERHPAYNRVLLAGVLARQYGPEVIALPAPGPGVRWRAGVRATAVDTAAREVVCDDGTREPYGTLVLATGAAPVLPPRHDGELPEGVRAFRTLDDALADPGGRAVVVGGGLLGVSAAAALAVRGVDTVLAQQGERLMERQLDAAASALLREQLTALGVEVHTGCRVRRLRPGGVLLARGSPRPEVGGRCELAADTVFLACGVLPLTGLAREAGIAVGRTGGIVVDDRLRTSQPHVHAIGDCAEHAGVTHGLAGAALEQADVLGDLLNGRAEAAYHGSRPLYRLSLPGPIDVAAFGTPSPTDGDDTVRLTDATRGTYRSLVVRGDRLRGGVLVGDLGAVGLLTRAWESDEALPATPLLHLLTHDGGN
ncbi:NAD(P)/FAD-dependent oxidoreductase [Streptomyces sp. XC 2026]|uniref:NAD(P)/FAD-dependent oxidoreductase n=1 Tax=Streptomyces sp. XC 2026 TaxID=2782004 RepID=UPI00190799FE|nr:FAD-dependent oxidoreductase [Streptomyces sp. XC 2026]QQN79539.1 NAD(P)/FAD-dependent oxidoreductase [Streptomyces sp. XC 2026]